MRKGTNTFFINYVSWTHYVSFTKLKMGKDNKEIKIQTTKETLFSFSFLFYFLSLSHSRFPLSFFFLSLLFLFTMEASFSLGVKEQCCMETWWGLGVLERARAATWGRAMCRLVGAGRWGVLTWISYWSWWATCM